MNINTFFVGLILGSFDECPDRKLKFIIELTCVMITRLYGKKRLFRASEVVT